MIDVVIPKLDSVIIASGIKSSETRLQLECLLA